MLSYGFSVCRLYIDENDEPLAPLQVNGGVQDTVSIRFEKEFRYLDVNGNTPDGIEKRILLPDEVAAPIQEGEAAGEAEYYMDGRRIGTTPILYCESIEKAGYMHYVKKVLQSYLI